MFHRVERFDNVGFAGELIGVAIPAVGIQGDGVDGGGIGGLLAPLV